jgi:hypothetical protein
MDRPPGQRRAVFTYAMIGMAHRIYLGDFPGGFVLSSTGF